MPTPNQGDNKLAPAKKAKGKGKRQPAKAK
jgi:hypothetical protein